MVQIHENSTDGAGIESGTQPRVVPKRSFNAVINHAYVFYQLKKELAPCIEENAETSIIRLAKRLSTHMQLVVRRQLLVEPPPAQMLRFTNNIPAELFTNRPIVLQIELLNIESGSICTGEPASPLKVEIFVTTGTFTSNDQNLRMCKPLRPRNKATMSSLVQAAGTKAARKCLSFKSKLVVKMHNGRVVVKVKITDNSSWVRSKMFRLVARVVQGSYQQRKIKEAVSESFPVKESKLEARRKADVPSPTDPTWRLVNVGKIYEKRLHDIGIHTVQDFLNKLDSDPEGLKKTIDMQNMKWESTVDHARQCRVSSEEVNVSNSGGNRSTVDSVTSNTGVQQGNMEDTNLIDMGMGQQRDPPARFGSDQMEHFNPISDVNQNNAPSGAFEEMPEQPSTGLEIDQWEDYIDWSALDSVHCISNYDQLVK
ncbi:calmodulin-binding protein 60 B-like [Carex rostrata]